MPFYDRKKFFDLFRSWRESITQEQVDGFNYLLDEIERDPHLGHISEPSYMLATTFHETDQRMTPIREYGRGRGKRYGKKYAVKNSKGEVVAHQVYYGRGYVQLTWLANYQKMTSALRSEYPEIVAETEREHGLPFDLVRHPDLALDPQVAYAIMSYGMRKGSFTTLGFRNSAGKGYVYWRRIINGTDKAELIAKYAEKFEAILRASVTDKAPTIADRLPTEFKKSKPEPGTAPEPKEDLPAETGPSEEGDGLDFLTKYSGKAEEFANKATKASDSVEKISRSSFWTFISTKATGIGTLIEGIWTRNQLLIIVGTVLILAGLVYMNWSKIRATARHIASKGKI